MPCKGFLVQLVLDPKLNINNGAPGVDSLIALVPYHMHNVGTVLYLSLII